MRGTFSSSLSILFSSALMPCFNSFHVKGHEQPKYERRLTFILKYALMSRCKLQDVHEHQDEEHKEMSLNDREGIPCYSCQRNYMRKHNSMSKIVKAV
jgi:hypothetical protein